MDKERLEKIKKMIDKHNKCLADAGQICWDIQDELEDMLDDEEAAIEIMLDMQSLGNHANGVALDCFRLNYKTLERELKKRS